MGLADEAEFVLVLVPGRSYMVSRGPDMICDLQSDR
jgi:hypothetical protein